MTRHRIVTRSQWLAARRELLAEEKAHTRAGDALAARRRALPWVRLEREYLFDTVRGRETLADLFAGQRQLVVYHLMLGTDWEAACASCSFWADSFDGIDRHLAARDTRFCCTSNGPLDRLLSYRARMGWSFEWVSSVEQAFSLDFGVTFPDGRPGPVGGYNYSDRIFGPEMPGISTFVRLEDGGVAHTYSTFGRGIEPVNAAYALLDMTAHGRNEQDLPYPMAWVRRHDEYARGSGAAGV